MESPVVPDQAGRFRACDFPDGLIQPHFSIHHISEQTFPVLRAEGYEIGSGLGILVSLSIRGEDGV